MSDLSDQDRTGDWSRFLKTAYKKEMGIIAREYPHVRSIIIDYRSIERWGKAGIELADELIENPGKVLEDIKESIKANNLIHLSKPKDYEAINIRFVNLPKKTGVRNIRSNDINRFISVEGILRKTTEVRPRVVEAVFKCPAGHFTVRKQKYGKFIEPEGCGTDGCAFKKLELLPKRSSFTDSQKLRIQESPEGLRGGEQAQTLDIDVTDDLSGTVSPGDRVIINGILRSIQRIVKGEKSTVFDIFLECNSIEVAEKEFEEVEIDEESENQIIALSKDPMIYRMISQSIAPTIYGSEDVKQAIALQLFGGFAKDMPDGSRLRGDIHVLLIGDPGIAKSQLLRYVVKLSPRAVYTSGQSSTAAGLTAAAVKDEFGEGRWSLEAGALVLADMGQICVDEMDKMSKEDRSALHEAMEQQCYDDQTEILTKEGWKFFKNVNPDDKIATLSPLGELEYNTPSSFTNTDYTGEMYYIKSRQVDLAVTPNHKIYVNINKRANDWNGFALSKISESPVHKRMRFKKNAVWKGTPCNTYIIPSIKKFGNQNDVFGHDTNPISIRMDDWLEFMGFFISEGSVQEHYKTKIPYRVCISQTKPHSTKIIRDCLNRLPFNYSYDGKNFIINSKQLATHLGKKRCYLLKVPDYIKQLPSDKIRIFLNALVIGDGHVSKKTGTTIYITSSPYLADDVTELLLKVGWSGNKRLTIMPGDIVSVPRGDHSVSHGCYEVSFIRDHSNEPNINSNGARHITKQEYSGKIYCLDVPNHIIYVRRNGFPVWCGNSISIAKAGITATLKSRCSLLGAANPKYGRFDMFGDIADQINMPPSLLSRFDLIFIMADKPEQKMDLAIAEHIIKAHSTGELIAQNKKTPIKGVTKEFILDQLKPVMPEIDPTLFRKYVAHAKRSCFPILSKEAKDALIGYYMNLRNLVTPDKAIPVTARQLEALVRLAEASARIRLSNTIDITDAERVIHIVDACLRQVAYDAKTGTYDIDKITTGTSKRKRDLVTPIMDCIRSYKSQGCRKSVIEARLVELKIEYGDTDLVKVLESLTREGDLTESKGIYKVM